VPLKSKPLTKAELAAYEPNVISRLSYCNLFAK